MINIGPLNGQRIKLTNCTQPDQQKNYDKDPRSYHLQSSIRSLSFCKLWKLRPEVQSKSDHTSKMMFFNKLSGHIHVHVTHNIGSGWSLHLIRQLKTISSNGHLFTNLQSLSIRSKILPSRISTIVEEQLWQLNKHRIT